MHTCTHAVSHTQIHAESYMTPTHTHTRRAHQARALPCTLTRPLPELRGRHLHPGGSGSGHTWRPSGKPRSCPQSPDVGTCPGDIFPWSLREEGQSDLSSLCRDQCFLGGGQQPRSSPCRCPHLGLGLPEPCLLRQSLGPGRHWKAVGCSSPGAGARAGCRQVQGHMPPSQKQNRDLPLRQDNLLGRSRRPGHTCVPGEPRPDTHIWTLSFLGCYPHMGLLGTGVRMCADLRSPGVTASAHSPPHPTRWTPHPRDGVWPLSHSPQGGETPPPGQHLGHTGLHSCPGPPGPASVPAGPQSWGGCSRGLPLLSRKAGSRHPPQVPYKPVQTPAEAAHGCRQWPPQITAPRGHG